MYQQQVLDLGIETQEEKRTDSGIGTIACCEEPQLRLENFGAPALSDAELLAIVLQGGVHRSVIPTLTTQLIKEAGSIAGLAAWHVTDFRRIAGIGSLKARQLVAIVEIARRVIRGPSEEAPLLSSPELIAEYMAPLAAGLCIEKMWTLCLNRKNRLIKCVEISSGTATSTYAHPREVFRAAIREGGATTSIAVCHNHPSGCDPSQSDVTITRQLREASKALDIEFSDHIIVGRKSADPLGRAFYSFRQAGYL